MQFIMHELPDWHTLCLLMGDLISPAKTAGRIPQIARYSSVVIYASLDFGYLHPAESQHLKDFRNSFYH